MDLPADGRALAPNSILAGTDFSRAFSVAAGFSGGGSFGDTGPYERLCGKAHFAIDPDEQGLPSIIDLDLAPRNARGLVKFAATLDIIKPVELSRRPGRPALSRARPQHRDAHHAAVRARSAYTHTGLGVGAGKGGGQGRRSPAHALAYRPLHQGRLQAGLDLRIHLRDGRLTCDEPRLPRCPRPPLDAALRDS